MMRRFLRFRFPPIPALLAALVLTFVPTDTAAAQELPRVRVTRDNTTIRAMRYNNSQVWRLMQAQAGATFDVIDVDGDQQQHREANYYLVLLPRDAWGTQWVGWISGRYVVPAPPREPVVAALPMPAIAAAATRPVEAPVPDRSPAPTVAATSPAPVAVAPRVLPEVVLHFAFDRSDLSEAAKYTLGTAMTASGVATTSLSFALGGHTDATGPDTYNQKLGLARAESVRKYIVDELQVSEDRVRVSSYGETQPTAPNTTREGRAENRRVVVTVTAPAIADAR